MSAGTNGHREVTVAIAAVVLEGKRDLRHAQWLKMYDREEDKFFAVRPFLLVVKDNEVAEAIQEKIRSMVQDFQDKGLAYIGELSFETNGGK